MTWPQCSLSGCATSSAHLLQGSYINKVHHFTYYFLQINIESRLASILFPSLPPFSPAFHAPSLLRGDRGEVLCRIQIEKPRSKQRSGEGAGEGRREGWMERGCWLEPLMMRKMEGHVGAMAGWRARGSRCSMEWRSLELWADALCMCASGCRVFYLPARALRVDMRL